MPAARETVRRYDGSTKHTDWCRDDAHEGKCLDRLLDRIGMGCEHDTIRSHIPYDGLAECCVCGQTVPQHRGGGQGDHAE